MTFTTLNPVNPPVNVELFYRSQLIGMIRELRDSIMEELKPLLKEFYDDKKQAQDSIANDATPFIVERIKRVLSDKEMGTQVIVTKKVKRISDEFLKRLNQYNRTKIISSINKGNVDESLMGVIDIPSIIDREGISEQLSLSLEENINLIKSVPQQYLANIQKAVYGNLTGNLGYKNLLEAINNCGAKEVSRAKMIARDQTAKINSDLNRVRAQNLGCIGFQWITSHDSRVRSTHKKFDGKYYLYEDWKGKESDRPIAPNHKPFNDPPRNDKGETILPGRDYQCRCVARDIINWEAA